MPAGISATHRMLLYSLGIVCLLHTNQRSLTCEMGLVVECTGYIVWRLNDLISLKI